MKKIKNMTLSNIESTSHGSQQSLTKGLLPQGRKSHLTSPAGKYKS